MKHFKLLIISILLAWGGVAQEVQVNRLFTADGTVTTPVNNSTVYKFTISGHVKLLTDSSLVRVLLHRKNSADFFLAYEVYPLITSSMEFDIQNSCEETFYLEGIKYDTIEVQIVSAQFTFTKYNYSITNNPKGKSQLVTQLQTLRDQKISKMNTKLAVGGLLWRAEVTGYSDATYAKKAIVFGKKQNLEGYDFFESGIFYPYSKMGLLVPESASLLPLSFDWRTRHGATNHNSPYFDGNPTINDTANGWMTAGRCQHIGPVQTSSCWIFGPIAATEAVINLYFNQHVDYDLAEQQVIACVNNGSIGQNSSSNTFNYLKYTGVVNESCFPFVGPGGPPCSGICLNPENRVKIAGYEYIGYGGSNDYLKTMLITKGPLEGIYIYPSKGGHSFLLVGYNTIKAGDVIDRIGITVPENSPFIGKTYWVFKNSGYGSNSNHTYQNIMEARPSYVFSNFHAVTLPVTDLNNDLQVIWHDYDNDSYFNWGIGPKPALCPTTNPADADDNNPFIGPYDQNYWPVVNCSTFIYQSIPLEISTTQTWKEIKYINQDIIVKTGKTLTIRDYVFMVKDSKIIVERGAKLVIDGGVLTCPCGNTWKGIEVWGDKTKAQYASYQGIVQLKNSGVIEHATSGITTSKKINGTTDWNYTGGIIWAENSTFKNNYRDVEFLSYFNLISGIESGNASYFRRCTFKTDANVLFSGSLNHVSMSNVNGVKFSGCTFEDKRGYINIIASGGTGIYAINSGFRIDEYCSTPMAQEDTTCNGIRTVFSNLLYGVNASGLSSANFTVHIVNSDFNSWRGIYLNDVDNAEIILNHLNVPVYNVSTSASNYRYGIYLDGCTLYTVEGNQLTSNAHTTTNLMGSSFGIVVKNSMVDNNSVYRNYYHGFGVGSEAIGANRGLSTTGLGIKCNDYMNGKYDIYIHSDPQYPTNVTGIAPTQQANLFSNGSPILLNNYLNQGTWINYSYCSSVPRTNPQISTGITEIVSPMNYSCPTTLGGGFNPGEARATALQSQQLIQADKTAMENLTDDGSTEGLITDVITTGNEEAYKTYRELMSVSPYVSKDVLKEVGAREEGLTAPMIRNVMVANPQGAKDKEVVSKLENRTNALPEYMLDQVMDSRNLVSALEKLHAQFNLHKSDRDRAVRAYIKHYTDNSEAEALPHIHDIYKQINDPSYRLLEAELLIGKGQFEQARSQVEEAVAMGNAKEQEYFSLWNDFYQVYINWLIEGKDLAVLGTDEIDWLKGFELDHPAYNKSLTLMRLNNAVNETEPLYLPEEGKLKSGKVGHSNNQLPARLALYPNPAKDYITVEYDYPENQGLILQLTDIVGRIVYKHNLNTGRDIVLVDVHELCNGQYILNLKAGNKVLQSKGFSILR